MVTLVVAAAVVAALHAFSVHRAAMRSVISAPRVWQVPTQPQREPQRVYRVHRVLTPPSLDLLRAQPANQVRMRPPQAARLVTCVVWEHSVLKRARQPARRVLDLTWTLPFWDPLATLQAPHVVSHRVHV